MSITLGDKVPTFKLEATNGDKVSLADFKGKKIVLYFYPKDNTPGCTREACAFRDYSKEFEKSDTVIVGVSKDTIKTHYKFQEKHELPFILISDPDLKLAKAFNVFKEKSIFGKTVLGIVRSTFLIDEQGKVVKEWKKVKVDGHVEKVLEELNSM